MEDVHILKNIFKHTAQGGRLDWKGKVVPVFLIHTMKAYWGVEV
jgi:hypothetical protein